MVFLLSLVCSWTTYFIRKPLKICCFYCAKIRSLFTSTRFFKRFLLIFRTLTYNEFTSGTTLCETISQPVFWFLDHFLKYLGPTFIVLMFIIFLAVAIISYLYILPDKIEEGILSTGFHLIAGNYLFICAVFYYWHGARTHPGKVPAKLEEVQSVCKKCVAPRPPRAHHCSVCRCCILQMDHHCPWLNNCVGLNNHRFFYLFCLYMWLGSVFLLASTNTVFYATVYDDPDPGVSGLFFPAYAIKKSFREQVTKPPHLPRDKVIKGRINIPPPAKSNKYKGVLFIYIGSTGLSVAMLFLLSWHGWLISHGETSIEYHINRRQEAYYKKQGMEYRNPYNHGFIKNWKIFLGIYNNDRSFVKHVLLPSSHKPDCDGIHYHSTNGMLILL